MLITEPRGCDPVCDSHRGERASARGIGRGEETPEAPVGIAPVLELLQLLGEAVLGGEVPGGSLEHPTVASLAEEAGCLCSKTFSEPNRLVPVAATTTRPIPGASRQDPASPQEALRASPAPASPWKASSEWGNHLRKAFCLRLQGITPKPPPSKSLSPHPTSASGDSSGAVLQKHHNST